MLLYCFGQIIGATVTVSSGSSQIPNFECLPTHNSAQYKSGNQHQAEFELQLPGTGHGVVIGLGASVA